MIRKTMSLRISATDSFKCTSYCLAVQIILPGIEIHSESMNRPAFFVHTKSKVRC